MRIVSITGKILYVVGVYALLFVLNIFVFMRLVNPTIDVVIVAILNIAYVVVGVRTFRGATENREDPRAWWRATARPAAGFWIGAGLAVGSGISLLGALASKPENSFVPAVSCVVYGALAIFYLHSSYKLRMLDQP
ncbi:hypothetical protein [Leifsonia poae]|uniref:Uncharacterized protein n=1 Tax=Leifsonia poae TaxID=110933 RepID=A0A9W6H6P6_9MICO|nr:hypothetical protein [Leifsonia poae]GLJ74650.1 hypothetical protein GCM10017584_02230 [Leifsonia poae]